MNVNKYGTSGRTYKGPATAGTEITRVSFSAESDDLVKANNLLLRAVGLLHPLNDSFLGKRPTAESRIEINPKFHGDLRKFRDEGQLYQFMDYIAHLVRHSENPQASFEHGQDGFMYETVSGVACISFTRDRSGRWTVEGNIDLCDTNPVAESLKKEGFMVTMAKAKVAA